MKTLLFTYLLVGFLLSSLITAVTNHATPTLTTWYVSAATGNNGNDCLTPATACLTINAVLTQANLSDTVQIAAGVYPESLDINLPLTLVGAGIDSTFLDGGDTQRVITAASNPIVITNLTVQHGRIENGNGGGIFNLGTLTLENVRVHDNTAVNGPAGGIYNGGTLTLRNSEISGNSSNQSGGGLANWYNTTTNISHSLIDDNAGYQGGGFYNLGTLTITDSTVSHNRATNYSGGGLIIFDGAVTLERVTFSDNETVTNGGAISNQTGSLTLTNSTLSGNSAYQYGGLANESATAETAVFNSTIAYNVATAPGTHIGGVGSVGSISFQNSLVANNDGRNCQVIGDWLSNGHNLSSDAHCAFTSSGDLPNTPVELAPLATYADSPAVHGLLPGSAAIDGGDNSNCPATDQRGVVRPVDGDGNGTAVCDIGAFESRNQLVISDATVVEGNSGTTTAVFTVTLAPISSQIVTVTYATADGTATAGSDYTATNGTLIFSLGQSEQFVLVEVGGDTVDEPDESFSLNLSSASQADILDGHGTATIVDDDGLPTLTAEDVTVNEGNNGLVFAQYIVTLSPPISDVVSVDFATVDGTAVAASDYTAVNGTLTFSPGQTSALLEIGVQGDEIDEGASESFTLQFSNPVNANVGNSAATTTIVDDDLARVGVQLGPAVYEGNSGTKTAVFNITLSNPAVFPITVDFYTASSQTNDAATPGVDYAPISGTLTFAPGVMSQTAVVTIFGDTEEEPDELFSLYLTNANPVPIYASVSSGKIRNDDGIAFAIYLPLIMR